VAEGLKVDLPPELLERIAARAAELVAERASPRPYLTTDQAAEYLSCPKSRLYALVSAKRIPHVKDGSRTLFRPAELDTWLDGGGGTRP
jgi:excisionase family DNA binding protein